MIVVPVIYGVVVEGIVSLCLCRLACKSLGDLKPRFATVIDSFIGTYLVVAAFDLSGGYFNPVLATSLKAGCEGHTLLEHAVVYWIGACAGSILSTRCCLSRNTSEAPVSQTATAFGLKKRLRKFLNQKT